jgi:hypothetical protein
MVLNDELLMVWKEVVVACLEVLSQNFPTLKTVSNLRRRRRKKTGLWTEILTRNLQILSGRANRLTAMFGDF